MSSKIPDPINFNYRRPRYLEPSEGNSPRTAQDKQSVKINQQASLDTSYASYKRASDKANIIMDYAAEVAKKYTIPVSEESMEVRQAVARTDPDSNEGQYISFNTFVRMVDIVEDMANNVTYSVIDDRVIADPAANERRIRKKIDSRFGNDDGLLALLLVGGQIMTLYLIHQINGMWRGPEQELAAQKTTAGGQPIEQASPIAESLRQASVGFAAATLITGVNQALATLFLNDATPSTSSSTTVDGVIATARQTNLPPILGKIKTILGIDDYKIILKYAIKYISETKDGGYEFWWGYYVARRTRFLSSRSIRSAPMFSKKEHRANNYTEDGPIVAVGDVQDPTTFGIGVPGPDTLLEGLAAELQNGLNFSIVQPTDQFLCALDYESSSFERGLNALAQILDTRVSRDVLCCLVRFLSNTDIDLLRKIRAVLAIFLNAQNLHLGLTLQNFMAFLVNWVRDTALRLIMELVQAILDKIYRVIQEFLLDLNADLGVLESCPLILELINGVLDSLTFIMIDIQELVRNYIIQIELNISVQFGLDDLPAGIELQHGGLFKIHKKRSLRRIMAIIDGIINVIESGYVICDHEEINTVNPSGDGRVITYQDILDSPGITDLEDYLDVPTEVKDQYFADAYEIVLPDNSVIPSYDIGELQLADETVNGEQGCPRTFPDSIIEDAVKRYKERTDEVN